MSDEIYDHRSYFYTGRNYTEDGRGRLFWEREWTAHGAATFGEHGFDGLSFPEAEARYGQTKMNRYGSAVEEIEEQIEADAWDSGIIYYDRDTGTDRISTAVLAEQPGISDRQVPDFGEWANTLQGRQERLAEAQQVIIEEQRVVTEPGMSAVFPENVMDQVDQRLAARATRVDPGYEPPSTAADYGARFAERDRTAALDQQAQMNQIQQNATTPGMSGPGLG